MPVNETTPQAGVLAGMNPTTYNSADPIVLFAIQVHVQKVNGVFNLRYLCRAEYFFI